MYTKIPMKNITPTVKTSSVRETSTDKETITNKEMTNTNAVVPRPQENVYYYIMIPIVVMLLLAGFVCYKCNKCNKSK